MAIAPQKLAKHIQQVEAMPSVSAILQPLIGHLQQPLEDVDTQRVVDLWLTLRCSDDGKQSARYGEP
jgi:hypothetical protein